MFARRSLLLPMPVPVVLFEEFEAAEEEVASGFRNVNTRNSRLIHFRARDSSSVSDVKREGVRSRKRESRLVPTWREKSWEE